MRVLIVYGTTEGQTKKISGFLKEEAVKLGHQVELCNASSDPPSPLGFDLVLIGGSVHQGKYQSTIRHYVKEHHQSLNQVTSAFFSVSLAAASTDKEFWEELEEIGNDFLKDTGWRPARVEQVAGALLYSKYDFFKRFIMRLIAKHEGGDTDTSEDYEYTDWGKLKTFLKKMVEISRRNLAGG